MSKNFVNDLLKCVYVLLPFIIILLVIAFILKKGKPETFKNVDLNSTNNENYASTTDVKPCTTPNGCHGWATVDPCNMVDMYNNGFGATNLCMISEPYNKLSNNNISNEGYLLNKVYNT